VIQVLAVYDGKDVVIHSLLMTYLPI